MGDDRVSIQGRVRSLDRDKPLAGKTQGEQDLLGGRYKPGQDWTGRDTQLVLCVIGGILAFVFAMRATVNATFEI